VRFGLALRPRGESDVYPFGLFFRALAAIGRPCTLRHPGITQGTKFSTTNRVPILSGACGELCFECWSASKFPIHHQELSKSARLLFSNSRPCSHIEKLYYPSETSRDGIYPSNYFPAFLPKGLASTNKRRLLAELCRDCDQWKSKVGLRIAAYRHS
jgi:hypothetical protein